MRAEREIEVDAPRQRAITLSHRCERRIGLKDMAQAVCCACGKLSMDLYGLEMTWEGNSLFEHSEIPATRMNFMLE